MANEKRFEHSTAEAKKLCLQSLAEGATVADAMAKAGRSYKRFEDWKKTDEGFRKSWESLRTAQRIYKKSKDRAEFVGDFASFSDRYLGMKVYPHQQNIIDLIEGREPSWLHESMKFTAGSPKRILINVPPDHAKSMTVSQNWLTYKICQNPNIRVIIVSKTREKAKEFLYSIKNRLTHPQFTDMQLAFAPEGGFKTDTATWQSERIYLGNELRDSAEKDPTIQAMGVGAQIYGSRSDIIILDDCITLSNAHEYEKQIRWLQQEVRSRLGKSGILVILGTRVDAIDLYSEVMRDDRYPNGKSPWTVLRMPAVLEFADKPKDWKTLWPKSEHPWDGDEDIEPDENGLYPRWGGEELTVVRGEQDPKTWAMVYQQQDVSEDSVFQAMLVRRACNGIRRAGLLDGLTPGHPDKGMAGMWVVCSLDPAIGGDAGAVCMAVDRQNKMRYVLDAKTLPNATWTGVHELIRAWTEKYQPNQWRIEKNSSQKYLTQDTNLREWLANRGVPLQEHFTGKNKWDADWGVASMAPLFGWVEVRDGRPNGVEGAQIEFPTSRDNEGIKALTEQLITWSPQTKNKTDMVMALWFAEIAAREQVNTRGLEGRSHVPNSFLTPERENRRVVIDLNEVWEARNRLTVR